MFDYLDKFNNLSDDIKMAVDSDEALKIIEKLEKEYKVELASIIMRVAIKDINVESLPLTLFTELNLNQDQSEKLSQELKEKIFSKIADYLDMKTEFPMEEPVETPVEDTDNLAAEETIKEQDFVNSYLKEDGKNKSDEQAKKVIKILNLNYNHKEKDQKLFDLISKYLKGIKSKIELRQILTKKLEMGGFSFSDLMVDNIFTISGLIQKKEQEKSKKSTRVDKDVLDKINKLGYGNIYDKDQAKQIEAEDGSHLLKTPDSSHLLTEADSSHLLAPASIPNDTSSDIDNLIKKSEDEKLKNIKIDLSKLEDKFNKVFKEEKPEEEILEKDTFPASETASDKLAMDSRLRGNDKVEKSDNRTINKIDIDKNTGKVKMTDVKKMKVMGPIDEIRYLDLVNFRRMSKDPKEALIKLGEKIKSLEGLDYTKMLEAIKAWRQSPVHKLYLKIFLNAGNRGVPFDVIISELQRENKDYLKKEELDAIIEFNKTLRF